MQPEVFAALIMNQPVPLLEVTEISGNAFSTDINTFNISGNFTNDSIAEIEITWTNYDSNCDANYSGNRIYIAHYQSAK